MTPKGDIDLVRKKTRLVIRKAERRPRLMSFTSFRHGGFTELGDAELTDAQIRAISRQRSSEVVKGYVKRTQRQIIHCRHQETARDRSEVANEPVRQLSFDLGRKK
jgi:hypothetical protein